jgi:hypothetical protein
VLVLIFGLAGFPSARGDAARWDQARVVEAARTGAECETHRSRRSTPTYTCDVTWVEDGRTVAGEVTSVYSGYHPYSTRPFEARVIRDDPPTVSTDFGAALLWHGRHTVAISVAGGLMVAGSLGLAVLRRRRTPAAGGA